MPPRRFFVLTVPGLGGEVVREVSTQCGVRAARPEYDGRSDVVPLDAKTADAVLRLTTAEDVFEELGVIQGGSLETIVEGLINTPLARRVERLRQEREGELTYRVIVRVLSERGFRRTQLRRAMENGVAHVLRGWERADPASVELWLIQSRRRLFRLGARLTTSDKRQRGGRSVERQGALRPAVAAAMVAAAGTPRGILFDPCAGTGSILREAHRVGWRVLGGDLDPGALSAMQANAEARAVRLDARTFPFPDDAFGAIVSNLPFGGTYRVQGTPIAWYRKLLAETRRTAPSVVVLAPASVAFRQALGRLRFDLERRADLTLLGTRTTIWVLRRHP